MRESSVRRGIDNFGMFFNPLLNPTRDKVEDRAGAENDAAAKDKAYASNEGIGDKGQQEDEGAINQTEQAE